MKQNKNVNYGADLENEACQKALELLALIPEDLDKMGLLKQLQPICEMLSAASELTAEVFFRERIQPRFNLTNTESSRYIREIARLRKSRDNDSEEEPFEYSADFDGLIDLVESDGEPAFLIKAEGGLTVQKEVRAKGIRLVPPPQDNIPWLLPDASKVLAHFKKYQTENAAVIDQTLYDDLLSYYQSVAQLPSEESYHVLAAWTLHTWLLESADYSPYMCFCGPPERGKSRCGKGMTFVAYRGVRLESLSIAHLVRLATDLKASLFFDVTDFTKKAKREQDGDCILLRFERGASVFRVLRPGRGAHKDMELYRVFGATIVGTNQPVDELHETRSLLFHMPSSGNTFEMDITPELGLPLKERLVAFRAYHLGKTLPECRKPVGSRLGDISRPLLQMVRLARPEAEKMLLSFIQDQEAARMVEKSESPDASLIRAVCDASPEVKNGRLPIQTISNYLNRNKDAPSRRDVRWVGRRLRALGFHKVRGGHNGSRAILFDSAQVQQMASDYGVMSDTSVTAVEGRGDSPPSAVEALKKRLKHPKSI